KKGVNWSTAKLVTYTTDTTSDVTPEMEMFKSSGIKNLKGVIDFTAGDSAYQMSFDKLIYIPAESGWFGGEFEQVVRKGEPFMHDEEVSSEQLREIEKGLKPTTDTKPPAKTKAEAKTKSKAPPSTKPIRTSPTGIKSTKPVGKPTTKS
ncbi:MAG: hypothetical protein JWR72_4127, partial [Flavisolibacter sp.]|nr:hypothetical protein [Flavisolibacter sp.]